MTFSAVNTRSALWVPDVGRWCAGRLLLGLDRPEVNFVIVLVCPLDLDGLVGLPAAEGEAVRHDARAGLECLLQHGPQPRADVIAHVEEHDGRFRDVLDL